jgi:hypothetical protein
VVVEATDRDLRELGLLIRNERVKRLGAIERASELGAMNHNTWRRIERGNHVRSGSYEGIDRAFGLPLGTTLAASTGAEGRRHMAQEIARIADLRASTPVSDNLLTALHEIRDEIRQLAADVRELQHRPPQEPPDPHPEMQPLPGMYPEEIQEDRVPIAVGSRA